MCYFTEGRRNKRIEEVLLETEAGWGFVGGPQETILRREGAGQDAVQSFFDAIALRLFNLIRGPGGL